MQASTIIILTLYLANYCQCWVFTNVNHTRKMAIDGEYERNQLDDEENEISQEEYEELLLQGRFSLIYPGTKWCGAGDVADGYDDLGTSKEADICCREHDHCPDSIEAGEMRHNLTNDAYYTRLSCECDETFRKCLHNANTKTANQVGVFYFNVIGTKCYRNDYPVTGCEKKSGWLRRKCVKYTYDLNGAKSYQWFDVPNF